MARSKVFCKGDQFYCYSLSVATPNDERDIMAFQPVATQGAGLVGYLQHFAFPEELAGSMRTYLVRDNDTNELAGYFSLKAGLMTQDETHSEGTVEFDTIPGIELANFAVNKQYRDKHETARGCGKTIYQKLVMECVRKAAAIVGVSVVYLFSLPDDKVIANYHSYGFERLDETDEGKVHARLKPRYDAQCVFMFMPI